MKQLIAILTNLTSTKAVYFLWPITGRAADSSRAKPCAVENVGAHGVTAAKELAPQTESAILMEYLVAEAHRTTEEAMEGVPGADKETAEFLATARWYVNALLKGGSREGLDIVATDNPAVIQKFEEVGRQIDRFDQVGQQRITLSKNKLSAGGDVDAKFDDSFEQLIKNLDDWQVSAGKALTPKRRWP